MRHPDSKVLAVSYDSFGPYHRARLAHLAAQAREKGYEVIGLEIASREHVYPWEIKRHDADLQIHTVFPGRAMEDIPRPEMARELWKALNRLNPAAIAFATSRVAHSLTMIWGLLKGRPLVVMMDSKYDDRRRYFLELFIKRLFFSRLAGALVGGSYSRAYALFLGLPPENVFMGCDVVDNDYFFREAEHIRRQGELVRKRQGLPENYFLSVGRLAAKKNLPRLLDAFDVYRTQNGEAAWDLVIVGSGPQEKELKDKCRRQAINGVHFAGFKQLPELPVYYGLARCFIIPSSHNEQWGLVVNEAMASGLPVLVSTACGCAPELVSPGVNGYTFNPCDIAKLAELMGEMASGRVDLEAMGKASLRIIARWSLDTYSQNLLRAVEAGLARRHPC